MTYISIILIPPRQATNPHFFVIVRNLTKISVRLTSHMSQLASPCLIICVTVGVAIAATNMLAQSQRERPSLSSLRIQRASSELLSCTPTLSLYFSSHSPRAHILYGIPSCSRPGKLRALIKFSLGTLTERGPSFIKRRIKVIFP